MNKQIERVGIVGGGLMGTGIAQVACQAGLATTLVKASGKGMQVCRDGLAASFEKSVSRGKLSESDAAGALERLDVTDDRSALAEVDIVIESVIEDLDTKKKLFADLLDITSPDCIFASNTSTLKIGDLAASEAQERTIGLHFFSPVPAMSLVELAYLSSTTDSVRQSAIGFVQGIGKTPVEVVDSTGFIVNRLLVPYLLGAIDAYSTGLAPATNIDTAMKLGCAHPIGPLMLSDLIGLDIVLSMSKLLHEHLGEERFAPPALLEELVGENVLGKKTGRGLYDYRERPAKPCPQLWKRIRERRPTS